MPSSKAPFSFVHMKNFTFKNCDETPNEELRGIQDSQASSFLESSCLQWATLARISDTFGGWNNATADASSKLWIRLSLTSHLNLVVIHEYS